MKNSISLSIYALCMSAALCGCGQAQSEGTVRNQVMDPVTEIPEWLKVTVESALPSDSLNVWIPTGELATSSLIRVPRFPAPSMRMTSSLHRSISCLLTFQPFIQSRECATSSSLFNCRLRQFTNSQGFLSGWKI